MKAVWLARLGRLERAQAGGDWRQGSGLSSLLKAFEAAAADADPEPLDLEGNPMARLLDEAKRWKEKGEG